MFEMAQFKYRKHLEESASCAFDTHHAPSTRVDNPGIYRCTTCGEEVLAVRGSRLPGENHHRHADVKQKIEWQLVVYAQQTR